MPKPWFIVTFFFILQAFVFAQQNRSVFFTVPNGMLNVEGNDASRLPFSYLETVRYQQVYDASQFSQVPAGGSFITTIFFRADCSSRRSFLVTNLQVYLSTTAKGPDDLSSVFADNIGANETLVFTTNRYAASGSGGQCPGGFFTASDVTVVPPFFYNPAKGNLLMEMRNVKIDWQFSPGPLDESKLDAQNVVGDSISRIAAFSQNATVAETNDSLGLVTGFQCDPIPWLTIKFETNTFVVTWAYYPTQFQLQWSDKVGLGSNWTNYPGTVNAGDFTPETGFFKFITIPQNTLIKQKYFRLILSTTQPLGFVRPKKIFAPRCDILAFRLSQRNRCFI